MISIITINYNNKGGLEHTIQSVLSQENVDFEYVVIDGSSSDGSVEIAKSFGDRIDYFVSEPDSGIYNAMNKGIHAAKGDYLLFLNSGDVFYNSSVLNEASAYLKDEIDIVYGNLAYMSEGKQHLAEFPKELSFSYFFENSLPHPATFIKRNLFDSVFFYNEALRIVSDWEFFMCAVCTHKATYQHIDLVISYFKLDGISCDPDNKDWIARERFGVLQDRYPLFIKDTKTLLESKARLETNRFQMLSKLEKSKGGRKSASFVLRFLTQFFKG